MGATRLNRTEYLETLIPYENNPQRLITLQAVIECGGNASQAALKLRCNRSTINRQIKVLEAKAALGGIAHNGTAGSILPDPFMMKGQTIHRRADGSVIQQWDKTKVDPFALKALEEAIIHTLASVVPLRPVIAPQLSKGPKNRFVIFTEGDPHVGMKASLLETGSNFDLTVYEATTKAAFTELVQQAPEAETAVYIDAGDTFHAPDNKARTPRSGHPLDVAARFIDMVECNLRVKIFQIEMLLSKYSKVHVRVNPGNHDEHTATLLGMILRATYKDNPRIEVDASPNPYWYLKIGSVMLCSTHGDGPKIEDLPRIMATDAKEIWGTTNYKVAVIGHWHHALSKDVNGVDVHIAPTLAPNDAHHHAKGYRASKRIKAIIYDTEWGAKGTLEVSAQYAEHLTAKKFANKKKK